MSFKTQRVWAIIVSYPGSRDIDCYEFSWKEASEQLKAYRQNCEYPASKVSKLAKVCPKCDTPMTEVTTDKENECSIFEITGKIQTYNCGQCGEKFSKL